MNIRLIVILGSMFLSLFSNALMAKSTRGNGKVVKQERSIADFHSISITSGLDLYLDQGETCGLTIEADENLHEVIVTEVEGGVLKVRSTKKIRKAKATKILVRVKTLKSIRASGGADVYTVSEIRSESISLTMSGGSDLKMALISDHLEGSFSGGSDADLTGDIKNLNVSASGGSDFRTRDLQTASMILDIAGGSDAKLSGKTIQFEATASGGSDIKAADLTIKSCKIRVTGGSDAYIHVSDELDLTASGGSDVTYSGNPRIVQQSVTGASDIRHKRPEN